MSKVILIEILVSEKHHANIRRLVQTSLMREISDGEALIVPHDPKRDRERDCLTYDEAQGLER